MAQTTQLIYQVVVEVPVSFILRRRFRWTLELTQSRWVLQGLRPLVPVRVVGMVVIPCLVQSVQTEEAVGAEEVFLVRMVTD